MSLHSCFKLRLPSPLGPTYLQSLRKKKLQSNTATPPLATKKHKKDNVLYTEEEEDPDIRVNDSDDDILYTGEEEDPDVRVNDSDIKQEEDIRIIHLKNKSKEEKKLSKTSDTITITKIDDSNVVLNLDSNLVISPIVSLLPSILPSISTTVTLLTTSESTSTADNDIAVKNTTNNIAVNNTANNTLSTSEKELINNIILETENPDFTKETELNETEQPNVKIITTQSPKSKSKTLNITQLRALCKQNSLSTTGTKNTLTKRLNDKGLL